MDSMIRCNRLHWFEHVKQKELYNRQTLDLEVERNISCGHPKKSWLDPIKGNLRQWNVHAEICQYCSEWKKRLKTASHTQAGHVT